MLNDVLQNANIRRLVAIGLIALGLMLVIPLGQLWPLFVVLPGLAILAGFYAWPTKLAAPLALIGTVTTGTGLILLFQSLTGYWESWIYIWTLYGVFVGGGLVMVADRLEEPQLHQIGRVMTQVSFVVFLLFGGVVTLLQVALSRLLVMVLLVGAGAYLLIGNPFRQAEAKTPAKLSARKNSQQNVSVPVSYDETA
ncbi:MAG: hypothetical protein ACLFTK_00805 [Anaerolineales bacterium]